MNPIKLTLLITELKKVKSRGDVTLEEFINIANSIPDDEVKDILLRIADSSGSEDKLKGILLDIIGSSVDDDSDLNDLLKILTNVL